MVFLVSYTNTENVFEDLHPSWRLIRIIKAVKKIGCFKFIDIKYEELDKELASYCDKIVNITGYHSVAKFLEISQSVNFKEVYNSRRHISGKIFGTPMGRFIYDFHKNVNRYTQLSLSSRLFCFYHPELVDKIKFLHPPFQIINNKMHRSKHMSPEFCDIMIGYSWKSIASNELIFGSNFSTSKMILKAWLPDLSNDERREFYRTALHFDVDRVRFV